MAIGKKTTKLIVAGISAITIIGIVYLVAYPSTVIKGANAPVVGFERGDIRQVSDTIYYGPFPSELEIRELKSKGFTTIVTFLSPAIPAEAQLIKDEKALVQSLGMRFYNFPLYPWEELDMAEVKQLKEILSEDGEKSYIHCYRGIRRVINALENAGLLGMVEAMLPDSFQRGDLIKTGSFLAFGPYPTDEEVITLFKGGYRIFVSLLSDKMPSETQWINREREIANRFDITLVNFPLSETGKNSGEQIKEIIEYIQSKQATSRIYVHDFHGGSRITQVYNAYQNNTQSQK
jgi:protein tyrosine phosphatase (PTP) superfamily phosphohydrolase (DUF442 family)